MDFKTEALTHEINISACTINNSSNKQNGKFITKTNPSNYYELRPIKSLFCLLQYKCSLFKVKGNIVNFWHKINCINRMVNGPPEGLAKTSLSEQHTSTIKCSLRNTTIASRPCTNQEDITELLKSESSALPGLGAPATLTFGQDIGHPFAGKSYVALTDPLPELPRHQAHHLLVVLQKKKKKSKQKYI